MRSIKLSIVVILISIFYIVTVLSQDIRESEESNIPRNVLRKYKTRRVKTLDQNGNPVIITSTGTGQRVRRIRPKRPENENLQQLDAQPLVREQLGSSTDQIIIEPARVRPNTSRKQTSTQERAKLLGNVKLRERNQITKPNLGNAGGGTTRSYSYTNPDGSFTFGYEGDDGSFKEETRGSDCIVRGKYGYIDPDGMRREFAYTSGNPCTSTQKSIGEDSDESDENSIPERSNGIQAIRPRKPINRRPIPGFLEERFPNVLGQPKLDDQGEIVITPPPFPATPVPLVQSTVSYEPNLRTRQRVRQRRPKPTVSAAAVTANPAQELSTRSINGQVEELKNSLPIVIPAQSPLPNRQNRGFNFDQESQGIQSTLGRSGSSTRQRQRNSPGNYRTELIFDPRTGQYTSVLQQNVPGIPPLTDSLVYSQQLPQRRPTLQGTQTITNDPIYNQQKNYYEAQEYLKLREGSAGTFQPQPQPQIYGQRQQQQQIPFAFPQFHRQSGVISGFR